MRAVAQRVSEAAVTVDGRETARIGSGLLVLLGVAPEDGAAEASWMARKLAALRIFADDQGQMNRSVTEIGGGVIVVSQFTLYADCSRGNRPGFTGAARPEQAEPLYLEVVGLLRETLGAERVGTGLFGARMRVSLVNDGPVTVLVETSARKPAAAVGESGGKQPGSMVVARNRGAPRAGDGGP